MATPEKRFRCGRCEVAVFENEILSAGNVLKIKKVTFQKRYKAADGGWKNTNSLDVNEIPKAYWHFPRPTNTWCFGMSKRQTEMTFSDSLHSINV